MSDPSSEHEDLKALWQGQPKESDPMTLEHIQAISRRLDRNELRTMLVMFVTAVLASFVVGQQWQRTDDALMRAMWVLYGLGLAGCLATYAVMMRIKRDPTEPGGLFLHRRLERSLGLARGKNLLGLLPMVPWFVAMMALWFTKRWQPPPTTAPHLTPAQVALNWLPVVALAAAWLGVMLYYQPRAMRRLRQDLDDLDASMK